ncbi:lipid A biosynthesis acyltransferase [Lutibacter sp. HS1-25]|uniref:lysophospholipid acyltransferase family protein n=1 Tax=Lutibacter sp. HS1-25 TaxID=2485000 RepID=UPI0010119C9B|nr:lipid A biosynthesis acyltransferase [Lutibacter sp. HS1-25]RXP52293.1 lipid A biosynthesis acyltransferase [Lutibacter sp. HS1-25]
MNLFIFYLVYPFIWLISILPFRLLYIISDFIYTILYYVIGYRKKVVLNNLKLAFPEKSEKELFKIRKEFYHHFVDVFMEMVKTFTISKRELDKHYKYTNIELVQELKKDGKSVILISAHYANWEWIIGMNAFINYNAYAAFTKVSNPYFNNKILKTREKFGVTLKQSSKILPTIYDNYKKNIQSIYGLLSDQSPQLKKGVYWTEFLGVKVPVHTGGESLAKKYNMNIVFLDTRKIKRGYYETTLSLITDNANNHPDFELTDLYLRKVEAQIKAQPAYYFWTHRRFKHKDKFVK